ncbi:MAG: hypothetical protein PVJ34_19680, partial [Anaerolineae bacterium]
MIPALLVLAVVFAPTPRAVVADPQASISLGAVYVGNQEVDLRIEMLETPSPVRGVLCKKLAAEPDYQFVREFRGASFVYNDGGLTPGQTYDYQLRVYLLDEADAGHRCEPGASPWQTASAQVIAGEVGGTIAGTKAWAGGTWTIDPNRGIDLGAGGKLVISSGALVQDGTIGVQGGAALQVLDQTTLDGTNIRLG